MVVGVGRHPCQGQGGLQWWSANIPIVPDIQIQIDVLFGNGDDAGGLMDGR